MNTPTLSALLERFFAVRLMQQRHVSPNTVASYRDTFRLLLVFVQKHLGKTPSSLNLEDIDAILISTFLEDMEERRKISARTRNLRLTAIRSFFHFVSYEEPAYSAHIQRVLAVPSKRQDRKIVHFLTRSEIEALLAAPNQLTWIGRRDYTLMLLAVQTGLRLSEIISLDSSSIMLGSGAHVHCMGKGRNERCTPLTRFVSNEVRVWLKEPTKGDGKALFSTRQGRRLSADTVQYLVTKYAAIAREHCPSLEQKRVTPHVLRHSAAMELLQAGVDCSVIALWLGHESVETTQVYLHAHMALKEAALAKVDPLGHAGITRYQPGDALLAFLNKL
jgi:integrase/recombinase XerD